MMESVVICGSNNKDGLLVGPMNNSSDISKNEWQFKITHLILTAKYKNISDIFEIGCSLSLSDMYDYEKSRFVTKNTTLAVKKLEISKGQTIEIVFSDSVCPFLKVSNVKDRIEISLTKAGTSETLPEDSVSFVCHVVILRTK